MDSYMASGLVLYPYVFVAGPNKHDTFLVLSLARKLQHDRFVLWYVVFAT